MSLPYGLLGLLTYRESTGYELTKMFEDSLNNFWYAQSSQIYRELDRMETMGWVYSKNVVQDKRPNKRVYAITEDGRDVLAEWLKSPAIDFERPHEPFLMKLFFGAEVPEATIEGLKKCKTYCEEALAFFPNTVPQIIAAYAKSIPDGEAKSEYWQMTMEFGVAQTEATIKWAQACIERLEGKQ